MTMMTQGRREEQIGAKTTKKWNKNYDGRHNVVEASPNQNGVIFFSSLKIQQK